MDLPKVNDVVKTPLGVMIVAEVEGTMVKLLGVRNLVDKGHLDDKVDWNRIGSICEPATAEGFVDDTVKRFNRDLKVERSLK